MRRDTGWQLAGMASSLILVAAAGLTLIGCRTTACHSPQKNPRACRFLCPEDKFAASSGGAQLWAENCARCHNDRPATSYSDAEWDVAMHHMRVRANLTGEEHRKIVEFLKAAN
ncbi:MAG: cytochrome c [Planctomycetes bacterium]|nr:cytochrome c [Planctomycetota bacterium]